MCQRLVVGQERERKVCAESCAVVQPSHWSSERKAFEQMKRLRCSRSRHSVSMMCTSPSIVHVESLRAVRFVSFG